MNTQVQEGPQGRVEMDRAAQGRESLGGALKRLVWVLPVSVLVASMADVALYEVVGVLDPEVTGWQGAGPAQIVGANMVYLLMGAALLLILIKLTRNPARWFTVLATVGVLVSLVLPVFAGLGDGSEAVPAAGLSTVITLSMMHLVSYAIGVPLLLRLGRRRRG